jgi:O-antigen/teichoic acid export membrane protein
MAAIMSGYIGRYFAIKFFERIYTRKIPNKENSNKNRVNRIIFQLWNSAKKMGIVQIGSFLLQRGSIIIISSGLGLKLTAEYGISITIFSAIIGFSTVICQVNLPNLSAAQIKNDKSKLSEIYGEILIVSSSIYILCASIILLFGNNLLLFIKSNSNLISEIPLLILAIALFFEMIHGIAASYLTTLNQVPFMRAAIYSGSASFILSLILVKPMGILGVVLSQALIQALYNNWQWPKRVHKHLGIGMYELYKNGAIRLSVNIVRFYKNG